MILHIPLAHKRVLIIGGGLVALRKARYFLAQKAEVHILAKAVCEELRQLAVVVKLRAYASMDVKGFDLVYAASDDAMLNDQITQDAQAAGCLALSVHYHQQLPQMMMEHTEKHVCIGVSTNGSYPAMNVLLLQRFQQVWEQEFQEKTTLLSELRLLLLQTNQQTISELLKSLVSYSVTELRFLHQAMQVKQAIVYAFHGAAYESCIRQEILPFLASQQASADIPAGFAFLSEAVVARINVEQHQVSTLAELLQLLSLLQVQTIVVPMLLQTGRYHHQLIQLCQQHQAQAAPLYFVSQVHVQQLIATIEELYQQSGKTLLILYHSSEQGAFSTHLASIHHAADTFLCHEKLLPRLSTKHWHPQVIVYSLYMLSGFHMRKEEDTLRKLFPAFHFEMISHSCLQEPFLRQVLQYHDR